MPNTTWPAHYRETFNGKMQGHPWLNEIRADGAVDPVFQQAGVEIMRTIQDARVRDFVLTGTAP